MSDLPADRLHESPPFTNTGLDVFGPYLITEGLKTRKNSPEKKMWAVIFTCLVSRATHIEPLTMMDTSSFVNALRRFFAIRGTCKRIRSDRGSNFVGALNQAATISLPKINEELTRQNCEWELNPSKASHFGGVWERKIGCAKSILGHCLLKLGSRHPTRDEIHTFLQEAASIMNNTPLSPVSSDPNEPFPLTPAMLLTAKTFPNPAPPEAFTEADHLSYGSKRWRRVQILSDEFFKRWREEYVSKLTEKSKWLRKKRCPKEGDIFLIKEDLAKRNDWPIGRVIKIHPSKDGLIRSVTLRLSSNGRERILIRPITKLVLLLES